MKAHQSSNVISWGRYPGLKSALHMADNWFYAGILCPQAGITRPIQLPPSYEYSLETLKWESIELVDFLLESSVSHGEGLRWRQRGRAGISKPAILTTMAVLVVDSHRCCNGVCFLCVQRLWILWIRLLTPEQKMGLEKKDVAFLFAGFNMSDTSWSNHFQCNISLHW